MPLCPSDSKTIIEWQYPDEEKNRIIGADDYKVEQEQGKCPVFYHVFGTYYSKNHSQGGCNLTAFFRTASSVRGDHVLSYLPQIGDSNRWVLSLTTGEMRFNNISFFEYENKNLTNKPGTYGIINYTNTACRNTTGFGYGFNLIVTNIVRVDGQPDDCGNCILTISKNGQTVYQRSEPVCPIVEHFCDANQCPAGTCEVECNGTVCCYDSNGISVYSFQK